MILPQTSTTVLLLMLLSLFFWGSWASTFKMAGKWRFELYYMDFALGFMLLAVVFAFTFGNLGYDGFSLLDDLEHAGKRQWLFGFIAGVMFNLANMLLMSAISITGMAVAFPIGIGVGLIMSSFLSFVMRPSGNLMLLVFGCILIVGAIAVDTIVANILAALRHEEIAKAGKAKSTRRPSGMKGVILALVSGLLMGSFFPLIQKATETEVGLGPYAVSVVFALGVLLSTPVFGIFFMNLPVEGEPVEIGEYFKSKPKQHLMGWIGGAVWCTALVAAFAASAAPQPLHPPPAIGYLLAQGYPIVAALWGMLVWRELSAGDKRVRGMALVMLVLFTAGLTLMAISPLYGQKS
jgi:glucose uptake protein